MFIIFILCFILPPSIAEFTVAKYFTSHMVLQVCCNVLAYILHIAIFTISVHVTGVAILFHFNYYNFHQEAPRSATIFGTYSEGPVITSLDCQSGLSHQYVAELVIIIPLIRITYIDFLPTKNQPIYHLHTESNQYDVECSSTPNWIRRNLPD